MIEAVQLVNIIFCMYRGAEKKKPEWMSKEAQITELQCYWIVWWIGQSYEA